MRRWRYRPLQAVVVAVLAALVTACAGFAPLYYRAMQQASVSVALDSAPFASTAVQLSGVRGGDETTSTAPLPAATVAARLPARYRRDFHAPVLGYDAASSVVSSRGREPAGELIWRSGICDHLTITTGTCPAGPNEIAVSQADVDHFGYAVGSTVRVVGEPYPVTTEPSRRHLVPLQVVGVYEQRPGDYWLGRTLTGRSGTVSAGPPSFLQHDVWIGAEASFAGSDAELLVTTSRGDYLLDRDATRVDQLLDLGPVLEDLGDPGASRSRSAALRVQTGLPAVAQTVRHQIDQSRTTVPLLMAQLCLLVVVVLWLVLLAITEQRRPEVALARLHGRGRGGARRLLLAELLPIVLVALVPGTVLALGASWVVRTAVLPGDPPFEVGWAALAAVAAAAVALVGVTVVAVSRVAREPVERLLRRVPPRRSGWGLGVGEALVIAGAGAVVVVFATGGLDGPVALATPGLLAIVVGLVLAHLTTPTAALVGRRQLSRGRVRRGVSVLDAARSPATGRIVAMVTLAAALAVFSADALAVGTRNRALAAEQEAGAARVLDVSGAQLSAVRAALADVDPDGRRATPVVSVMPSSQDGVPTMAVVPDSFRRVALFPGGPPAPRVWDHLRTPTAAPLRFTGREMTAVVDSSLTSQRFDGSPTEVTVGVDIVASTGEPQHLALGDLAGPVTGTRLDRPVDCAQGCTVVGVWIGTVPSATVAGSLTLRGLAASPDGPVVPLGPARQWRAFDDHQGNSVQPSGDGDALTLAVTGAGSYLLSLQHDWLPPVVPALVVGALPPGSDGDRFSLAGIDGEEQEATRAGRLERVPAAPSRVFVVDLDTFERGRAVNPTDRVEIWLDDAGPALVDQVTRALDDRGVTVAAQRTLAQVRQGYDESAAAWSLQLAVLVGVVALLIGVLVLLVSAVSTWRVRARDLAALRMTGVPPRVVRSMAVASQLPALAVGIVAGAASGLVGAQLALPIVPLFADAPEVSTLDLDTAWAAVVLAVLGTVVALVLSSLLIGRELTRRAGLARLRETL